MNQTSKATATKRVRATAVLATFILAGPGGVLAAEAQTNPLAAVDAYNVVWTSPSTGAGDSMPLGNGDVEINLWVEKSGDLVSNVGKTAAWDENDRLCKVGCVRVRFEPAIARTDGCRQELKLREGLIEIGSPSGSTGTHVRLWLDAGHPVVGLEVSPPSRAADVVDMLEKKE